jgi:DNA-binding GntR family transcriptional regulator
VLTPVLEKEFRDFDNFGAIAKAVRKGDAEAAREAGLRHVEIGRTALERALKTAEAKGAAL